MANALVVTDVAHDQSSVGTVIDTLLADNSITSDKIIRIEVTPFGANQFLTTILYST